MTPPDTFVAPHLQRRQVMRLAAWPLAAAGGWWLPRAARAQAPATDWLVTPQEARALAADLDTPLLMPRNAGAPAIEVLRPTLSADPLPSPLPIELVFRPASGAAIDVASFRVFYGAFKLDVTQRLLKSVAVRPDGLRVDQAAIPAGSHRLVVQVADTQGRTGTKELRFSVA